MSEELQRVKDALAKAQSSWVTAKVGLTDVATMMTDTCEALLGWLMYQVQQEEQKQEK